MIVASEACAKEMGEVPPDLLAQLVANADALGPVAAEFVRRAFGPFQFKGITLTPPTETFSGESIRQVGAKEVHLIEVGPAHTRGDVLVHVPADRTVFTGDILFANAHPIIWAGPVANWVRACDLILAMEVETVVPGHGPLCGLEVVTALRAYLLHLESEAKRCLAAGLSREEAARAVALDDYASWGDAERIAVNMAALYRELGDPSPPAEHARAVHADGAARARSALDSALPPEQSLEALDLARCALELFALPSAGVRGRLVGGLEEREQRGVRIRGAPHGVVREQELAEVLVVRGGLR